jgi:haloalkane dehalogenase
MAGTIGRRGFLSAAMGAAVATALAARSATDTASAATTNATSPAADSAAAGAPSGDAAAARRHDKERRFIATPQGRIAYIDRGTGPAALFLHGFPLSSFQWRGCIDRLASDRRCLAPDWLGLGRTEAAADQSVTPAAQTQMLASFLDRLSISQVDVIANDSGGAVAQLFLAQYPHRVRSLLLTNCDVETDSPPAALLPVIDLARSGLYPDLWLEPWLTHKDVARSPTGLGGMCYANSANPTDAALEEYLAPLVESPARKALVNRYALGLEHNPLQGVEARLRECKVPVRVVWGMSDTIFSPHSPDYLAGILPRFQGVRRIHEAKLFFPEEYPDIIAAEAHTLWQRDGNGVIGSEASGVDERRGAGHSLQRRLPT